MSKEEEQELLQAVERENEAAIMKYVSLSVNVNCKDKNGDTPLHLALYAKNEKLINFFLSHPNVNVNAKNNNGTTPLHVVATNNSKVFTGALLASKSSFSVLYYSILGNDIDVNARNNKGETPLHKAASYNYTESKCSFQGA